MTKTLTCLLFFIASNFTVHAQRIGLKLAVDKGKYYPAPDGTEQSSKWNSKAIGITYEMPLSKSLINSIETGIYLNFKNDRKQAYYLSDYSYSDYFDNGSEVKLYNYNKTEKIRELHIPVFFKQYFYLGKLIMFASAGPKLAFTISDKSVYRTVEEGVISKVNVISNTAPRLYVYNFCVFNAGIELKKIQISFALKSITPGNRLGPAWRTNLYPITFYLGYMF